jgi:hypothetical protein
MTYGFSDTDSFQSIQGKKMGAFAPFSSHGRAQAPLSTYFLAHLSPFFIGKQA